MITCQIVSSQSNNLPGHRKGIRDNMQQLKMYRPGLLQMRAPVFPEGYTFSHYQMESDRMAWCACCRNGLIADDADESAYEEAIAGNPDIDQTQDVFFLDHHGEHIGTVTAYLQQNQIGVIHMVALRTDYRGKRLSNLLVRLGVRHLMKKNAKYAALTTDDWRKSAIRVYLNEGFLPVEYDVGMQERWERILKELKIEKVQMLCEDAADFRMIYRCSCTPDLRHGMRDAD